MSSMLGTIWLYAISCRCRIGVSAQERKNPQKILVDVGLEMDLRKAGKTDDVRDTVDYAALEKRVRKVAEASKFQLLERLASELAQVTRALAPLARRITIRVHKRPSTMPKTLETVVEIRGS